MIETISTIEGKNIYLDWRQIESIEAWSDMSDFSEARITIRTHSGRDIVVDVPTSYATELIERWQNHNEKL